MFWQSMTISSTKFRYKQIICVSNDRVSSVQWWGFWYLVRWLSNNAMLFSFKLCLGCTINKKSDKQKLSFDAVCLEFLELVWPAKRLKILLNAMSVYRVLLVCRKLVKSCWVIFKSSPTSTALKIELSSWDSFAFLISGYRNKSIFKFSTFFSNLKTQVNSYPN